MEMNPSVFAVLTPQCHYLRLSTFGGGGGLFAGFDNKRLGIWNQHSAIDDEFLAHVWTQQARAGCLIDTHAIVLNWDL